MPIRAIVWTQLTPARAALARRAVSVFKSVSGCLAEAVDHEGPGDDDDDGKGHSLFSMPNQQPTSR